MGNFEEAVVLHKIEARPDERAVEVWVARYERTKRVLEELESQRRANAGSAASGSSR